MTEEQAQKMLKQLSEHYKETTYNLNVTRDCSGGICIVGI